MSLEYDASNNEGNTLKLWEKNRHPILGTICYRDLAHQLFLLSVPPAKLQMKP
jgi:hypothetical protein